MNLITNKYHATNFQRDMNSKQISSACKLKTRHQSYSTHSINLLQRSERCIVKIKPPFNMHVPEYDTGRHPSSRQYTLRIQPQGVCKSLQTPNLATYVV